MENKIEDGGPAFPSHGTMGEVNFQGMTPKILILLAVALCVGLTGCAHKKTSWSGANLGINTEYGNGTLSIGGKNIEVGLRDDGTVMWRRKGD